MSELTVRNQSQLGQQVVVSDAARQYIRKAQAPNTKRVYAAAWREFEQFAASQGKDALPADVSTVIEYLTALADNGTKVSTIEVKLAAIAKAHRVAQAPDPTVYETVRVLMAGIRRELKRRPAKKEPATLEQIRAMVGTLPNTTKGARDKALLLIGFAGAFRRSELVALKVDAIRLNGKLVITVEQSKTDQEGEGQVKTIPHIQTSESECSDICPVCALRQWLDTADIKSGAIFRRMDRHGNVYADQVTSQMVARVVKGAAKAAGLDWRNFSGHSLRSGFITQAMNAGAADSDIMEQTHHKTTRVMRGYRKNSGVGASKAVMAAFGDEG